MIPPKGLLTAKLAHPRLWEKMMQCATESQVLSLFHALDPKPEETVLALFIGEWRKIHTDASDAPTYAQMRAPLIPESFLLPSITSTYEMCKLFCTSLLLLTSVHRAESIADISLMEAYIRALATEALRKGPRTPEQLYHELLNIQFRLYARFAHGVDELHLVLSETE